MRKGFLATLIVLCVTGSAVLAQGPFYYPPAYGPPPAPPGSGYGSPQVLYGGTLQADGPILLPGQKAPPPKQAKTKDDAQRKQAKTSPVTAIFHPLTWFTPAPPIPPTQPSKAGVQPSAAKTGPIVQVGNSVACQPAVAPPSQPASFQGGPVIGIATAPGFGPVGAAPPAPEACPPDHELDHHGDRRLPEMPCGYRYYGSADWLYWFVKQPQAPPLVEGFTASGLHGVIGDGILKFDNGQHEGMRSSFGVWLNNCQTVGLEVGVLTLFDRTPSVLANPGSNTILARTFINAFTGTTDAVLLTNPGISTGTSRVETFSHMWSVEANLRAQACRFTGGHIDFLAGFRHLELDENLSITDRTQFENVPVFLSQASVLTHDSFGTENRFDGGQVGMEAQFQYGPFYVDMWGKVAVGVNHEHVLIDGSTVITGSPVADRNIRTMGGVLALPSNSGSFDHDRFAIVPEFGMKAGWRICDSIRIGAGYSFLYISRVDRPGDQIDRVVNPTQIPQFFQGPLSGPVRPTVQFHETDFWAHGVSVEIEYRF